jgi:glutathione S-transferase
MLMAQASQLTLYELAAADEALRFSPHCWKTRMALAHKGLHAERVAWRFTEKDRIAFSGQGRVPVLVDQGEAVSDSWSIALHLEERYPDRPSLFGAPHAISLTQFVNSWADMALIPPLGKILLVDIHRLVDDRDKEYFRQSRESRLCMTLEAAVADRPARLAEFRQALQPLRAHLKERSFIAGDRPAYADYCVFGMFMWARCTCDVDVLEPGDVVFAWRERLLDAFDGLARRAPAIQQ